MLLKAGMEHRQRGLHQLLIASRQGHGWMLASVEEVVPHRLDGLKCLRFVRGTSQGASHPPQVRLLHLCEIGYQVVHEGLQRICARHSELAVILEPSPVGRSSTVLVTDIATFLQSELELREDGKRTDRQALFPQR